MFPGNVVGGPCANIAGRRGIRCLGGRGKFTSVRLVIGIKLVLQLWIPSRGMSSKMNIPHLSDGMDAQYDCGATVADVKYAVAGA